MAWAADVLHTTTATLATHTELMIPEPRKIGCLLIYPSSKSWINVFKVANTIYVYILVRKMETATVSNANGYMPQSIANATIRLAIVKARKSPLIEYMQKSIKMEADIEDARRRLAKITSSMAAKAIESRAERL